jgi:glycosyltransferase involved in cell wall biosynthesis
MCYGKPIVAINTGSIPEMVYTRLNGYLIRKKTHIEGFALAVAAILDNKDLYQHLSKNSRHMYETHFNPDKQFDQLQNHF